MSAESIPTSLREFLTDLSAIRTKKEVTLDDLRIATKVYPHIISEFETNGLDGHPLFNNVYVRALVRSYAHAVGISAEEVVELYGKAVDGEYRRELAVAHLGLSPADVPGEQPATVQENAEPVFKPDNFDFEVPPSTTSSRVTWVAAESEKKPDPLAGIRNMLASILSKESALIQWGTVAIGGGIGLLLIMQLLAAQGSSENEVLPPVENEVTAAIPQPVELAPLEVDEPEVKEPPAPVRQTPFVLKDSLDVFVVASSGKLDPFRVRVDNDLRRPYWLDSGDSMQFRMGTRIVVEDNLEAMKIVLEGYNYPLYSTDSTAQIVITRDTARAFLAVRQ